MSSGRPTNSISAHGMTLLLPDHEAVRTLEKVYLPSSYGHKVWETSWVLIDYLSRIADMAGKRVMDLGCGWGLAGVFCAKQHGASVTGVDVDDQVQPYLDLTAAVNGVRVGFLNLGFHQVEDGLLAETDIIIGSDICFSATLIDPLRAVIGRAQTASVEQVLIADPGGRYFQDMAHHYARNAAAEVLNWSIRTPAMATGKILRIVF